MLVAVEARHPHPYRYVEAGLGYAGLRRVGAWRSWLRGSDEGGYAFYEGLLAGKPGQSKLYGLEFVGDSEPLGLQYPTPIVNILFEILGLEHALAEHRLARTAQLQAIAVKIGAQVREDYPVVARL
jgi:hypothetical protein